jgi:anthranilate/para-aminobenzoate synthase component I
VTLLELEDLPTFAVLGPGFSADGHWRLFTPTVNGDAALWLSTYEGSPVRMLGTLAPFTPEWSVASAPHVELDEESFEENVSRIRERIATGDVYQVNLTVRALVRDVNGATLLSRLCSRGIPRFAAWVRLPGRGELVSGSPELLVETVARWIHAEPMKGTAAAGQRAVLEASVKDQAELAMITDLTRNDLQQLCVRGTVQVPAARRFLELPYVVQAVSDIEGELRQGVTLADILRVMHPGGSVTGAPRPAAMAIIRELEPSPRRFYCGALGLEYADTSRVALLIRTATLLGGRTWEYGVGGGITWDSEPRAELEEVRLKLGALRASGASLKKR